MESDAEWLEQEESKVNDVAQRLMSMTVADVMTRDILTVGRADSMDRAADVITSQGVHGLVVVDEMGR